MHTHKLVRACVLLSTRVCVRLCVQTVLRELLQPRVPRHQPSLHHMPMLPNSRVGRCGLRACACTCTHAQAVVPADSTCAPERPRLLLEGDGASFWQGRDLACRLAPAAVLSFPAMLSRTRSTSSKAALHAAQHEVVLSMLLCARAQDVRCVACIIVLAWVGGRAHQAHACVIHAWGS